MKNGTLEKFKNWFEEYVDGFDSDDEEIHRNISLKHRHTYYVCSNILDIGKSLNLNQEDLNLAEAIALFHDVGRFEQFTKYKTFSDRISVNHSKLGIEILEKFEVLKEADKEEEHVIRNSVLNHNSLQIDASLNERTIFFTRLIRDADKLDIYRVFSEYYTSEDKDESVALHLLNEDKFSDKVIQCVLLSYPINYNDLKYVNDFKILKLSWLFDINFRHTFEMIRKNNYLHMIYDQLPRNEVVDEIFKKVEDYLLEKCYPQN